jgi:hypothetical protein
MIHVPLESSKSPFDDIICLQLLRSLPEQVVTLTGAGISCASGIKVRNFPFH